jgi:hypothetical protein
MLGIVNCNCSHEPGIPSKCESLTRIDYVPALCTYRPSLLPIELFSEVSGRDHCDVFLTHVMVVSQKLTELDYLEEVKVVTRFP